MFYRLGRIIIRTKDIVFIKKFFDCILIKSIIIRIIDNTFSDLTGNLVIFNKDLQPYNGCKKMVHFKFLRFSVHNILVPFICGNHVGKILSLLFISIKARNITV